MIFFEFDTLLNSNKPQDKRFRDTRFFLGHIDCVPRGLTVLYVLLGQEAAKISEVKVGGRKKSAR